MSASLVLGLFAPARWLSVRLGPWGRALFIGALLCALALPGALLARQWRAQMQALGVEQEGLQALVAQEQLLATLLQPRGAAAATAASDVPDPPGAADAATGAAMEAVLRQAHAHGAVAAAQRLERAWAVMNAAAAQEAPQREAALTATVDALRGLMRESARSQGLFRDAQLDRTFDAIVTQLPLLMQALGRPMDTPEQAAAPALLLSEMQPALRAGMNQLAARGNATAGAQLQQLQPSLARAPQAGDRATAAATGAAAAPSVMAQTRAVFNTAVTAAGQVLAAQRVELRQRLVVLLGGLAATWASAAYLLAGFQLRGRSPLPQPSPQTRDPAPAMLPKGLAQAAATEAPNPAVPTEVPALATPTHAPAPAAPTDAPASKLTVKVPALDGDALHRARVLQQALQPRDLSAETARPAAPAPMPTSVPVPVPASVHAAPQATLQQLPAALLPGKPLLLDLRLFLRTDEVLRVSKAVGKALAQQPDLAADARLCLEALLGHLIRQQLPGMPEPSAQLLLSLGASGLEIMLRDDAPPADLVVEPLDRGLDVVRSAMDEFWSFHDGRGNLIVLRKALHAAQPVGEAA